MSKRYAIITNSRQAEAFRVALGLTLLDDHVEIYVLDHPIADDAMTKEQFHQAQEMEIPIHQVSAEDAAMALALPTFDRVLPLL